jgi:hypothetical protein
VSPRAVALRRAAAPLALMALIFWLSAQPDLSTDLGLIDLVLRKIAHMVSFGALAALWWWALRPLTPRALAAAVAIAVLYAISDEYHQAFVEGRHGTPVDVAIDCVGIAVAALLAFRRVPRRAWVEEGAG